MHDRQLHNCIIITIIVPSAHASVTRRENALGAPVRSPSSSSCRPCGSSRSERLRDPSELRVRRLTPHRLGPTAATRSARGPSSSRRPVSTCSIGFTSRCVEREPSHARKAHHAGKRGQFHEEPHTSRVGRSPQHEGGSANRPMDSYCSCSTMFDAKAEQLRKSRAAGPCWLAALRLASVTADILWAAAQWPTRPVP
jgi:hypothetical protein